MRDSLFEILFSGRRTTLGDLFAVGNNQIYERLDCTLGVCEIWLKKINLWYSIIEFWSDLFERTEKFIPLSS